jgi:hypothetical protein
MWMNAKTGKTSVNCFPARTGRGRYDSTKPLIQKRRKLGWVVGVECPVSRDFKYLNRHGWHQKRCSEPFGQQMDGNLDGKESAFWPGFFGVVIDKNVDPQKILLLHIA